MGLDITESSTLGGLEKGKGSGRKLVMMQGEITGLHAAAITGVLTNTLQESPDPQPFAVDTVDATTKIAVGDRIFRAAASGGLVFEIGEVTAVSANSITVGGGILTDLTENDQILNSAVYDINADGKVTVSGGATAGASASDLVMNVGAGRMVVYGVDHQVGTDASVHGKIDRAGTGLSIEFTFGNQKDLKSTLNLVSAVGSFGYDLAGGTVGSCVVDMLAWGHGTFIKGNTAIFNIGIPYENEGGDQRNISDATILKFCVMAVANNNGV